jgi:hypothetical protein
MSGDAEKVLNVLRLPTLPEKVFHVVKGDRLVGCDSNIPAIIVDTPGNWGWGLKGNGVGRSRDNGDCGCGWRYFIA